MAKVSTATTLSPLPSVLHRGLTAVTVLGFLSFAAAALLFMHLAYRILTWKHRGYARLNQYVALLTNLILADILQGLGFGLNVVWLQANGITAGSTACWTQGWFLNAGDVGSCVFSLSMAVHLFADIVFDWRLSYIPFLAAIVGCWIFAIFCSSIGIALHPDDFYMRAGPWCWINEKYMAERLWLHYFWILLTEFATVVIYTLMFVVLWRRVKVFFYANGDIHLRAESAARSVVFYPLIYTICTLPAVIARLRIMNGYKVTYEEMSVVGAMLGSNGWLDVLLYCLTRHSLIFGPAVPNEDATALDTFSAWPRRNRNVHGVVSITEQQQWPQEDRNKMPNMVQTTPNDGIEDLFRAGSIIRIGANFEVHRIEARSQVSAMGNQDEIIAQSRRSSEKPPEEIPT